MVRIIVSTEIAEQVAQRMTSSDIPVEILKVDPEGTGAAVEEADAALRWGLSDNGLRSVLDRSRKLRWVHSASAGVESLPLAELRERDIILTNAAGVFAVPIAEWALTAMLMSVKRVHELHDAQRERRWANDLQLQELCGKTLLILGLGGIGREIARRAAPFSMRIWGTNRSGRPVEHVERVVSDESWRDLLPEADFVVVTLPLTPTTEGLIGREEISRLHSHAWLINVGRGAIVDEPALLDALHHHQIGGAAIDAWVTEPLPSDHPAWSTPNLIIWPHHSGSSPANNERGLNTFVENVRRFARGAELLNVVQLDAGY